MNVRPIWGLFNIISLYQHFNNNEQTYKLLDRLFILFKCTKLSYHL